MPLAGRTLTLATALTALLGLGTAGQRAPDGWQVPQHAETEANPLPATDDVLDRGRRIYESKCWRCHGSLGKGDGPEADPDRKPGDLSDPARASRNPDGIIFYKVWNGRRGPDMPAFKSELEPDDVWAVVHYVKTLRAQGQQRLLVLEISERLPGVHQKFETGRTRRVVVQRMHAGASTAGKRTRGRLKHGSRRSPLAHEPGAITGDPAGGRRKPLMLR